MINLTHCDSDRYAKPSSLYGLKPTHVGGHREGLLSYIVRLAGAHLVRPTAILRLMRTDESRVQPSMYSADAIGAIQGASDYAALSVRALERLTGTPGLEANTLLPLAPLLPGNGMGHITRHRRFCPLCLKTRHTQDPTNVGIPLIWSIPACTVCSEHQCALEERCGRCGEPTAHLPLNASNVYCARCCAPVFEAVVPVLLPSKRALHASAVCEWLIRHAEAAETADWARNFLLAVESVQKISGLRALRVFERALGFSVDTVRNWRQKGMKPRLEMVIHFLFQTGLSPEEVLVRPESIRSFDPAEQVESIQFRKLRKPPPAVFLSNAVKAAVSGATKLNVEQLANRLDVSVQLLRYRYPQEMANLTITAREAAQASRTAQEEAAGSALREAIRSLVHRRLYPSYRAVRTLLHGPVRKRFESSSELQAIRRQLAAECGLAPGVGGRGRRAKVELAAASPGPNAALELCLLPRSGGKRMTTVVRCPPSRSR